MPNTYQRKIFKLNLRKLILILTALAVSFLFVISLVVSYLHLKKELVKRSLFFLTMNMLLKLFRILTGNFKIF